MQRTRSTTPPLTLAAATFIGTAIEWYDFFIYGTAAALIFNRLFFPEFDPIVGTIAALATLATGYVGRPVGGALFGHLGDRHGRRSTLIVTLLMVGIATFLIGLLPTYAMIGLAAPLALVVLRVVQGIGLGGEWGGAVLLAVEHAPERKRGWYGSWPQMGAPTGLVLANLVFLPIAALPEAQLLEWGWRIPFLLSLVLVAVGLVVRRKVDETPAFTQLKRSQSEAPQPLLEVMRRYPRQVLLAAGARIAEAGTILIVTTFVLGYATQVAGLPRQAVIGAVLLATIALILIVPIAAALSDRLGRLRVYVSGTVLATVCALPAMWLIDARQVGLLMIGMLLAMIGPAIMFGPQASFFAELFGARVRYTGASCGFQLGAVLGGVAPIVAAALAAGSSNLLSVGLLLVGMGIISTFSALAIGQPWARTRMTEPVATAAA
jgi:metabolite-proton symporter